MRRMSKRPRIRAVVCGMLALFFVAGAVPGGWAETAPASFEGHTDLPAYAFIALHVELQDVAPYVPAEFRTVEVVGQTVIFVGVALFDNTSFDFDNGTTQRDPDRFAYSDLAIGTYGPEGSGPDAGGILYIWRHASAPIFPNAMARLGVSCGGGEPARTRVCHVPQLTVGVETSPTRITTHAQVPWGFSPHSISASFVPTALPCAGCDQISAWHAGSRGPVYEDVVFSGFPDSAIIGLGTGTVRPVGGSPLFHILGDREEATGPAFLMRVHIDATFTVE